MSGESVPLFGSASVSSYGVHSVSSGASSSSSTPHNGEDDEVLAEWVYCHEIARLLVSSRGPSCVLPAYPPDGKARMLAVVVPECGSLALHTGNRQTWRTVHAVRSRDAVIFTKAVVALWRLYAAVLDPSSSRESSFGPRWLQTWKDKTAFDSGDVVLKSCVSNKGGLLSLLEKLVELKTSDAPDGVDYVDVGHVFSLIAFPDVDAEVRGLLPNESRCSSLPRWYKVMRDKSLTTIKACMEVWGGALPVGPVGSTLLVELLLQRLDVSMASTMLRCCCDVFITRPDGGRTRALLEKYFGAAKLITSDTMMRHVATDFLRQELVTAGAFLVSPDMSQLDRVLYRAAAQSVSLQGYVFGSVDGLSDHDDRAAVRQYLQNGQWLETLLHEDLWGEFFPSAAERVRGRRDVPHFLAVHVPLRYAVTHYREIGPETQRRFDRAIGIKLVERVVREASVGPVLLRASSMVARLMCTTCATAMKSTLESSTSGARPVTLLKQVFTDDALRRAGWPADVPVRTCGET